MESGEIPVGLEKRNRVDGDHHRLVRGMEADSVLHGVGGFGDGSFF